MQQVTTWFCAAISVVLIVTSFVDGQEVILVSNADINPVGQGVLTTSDIFEPEVEKRAEREKRKILEPVVQASFGIKSALLNLIFGKVNQLIDFKTRLVDQLDQKNIQLNRAYGLYGPPPCDNRQTTVRSVGSTTMADIADINGNSVTLDIPSNLFSAGFSLSRNISSIVGDVILNTAERIQMVVEAAKPWIGKFLGIKPTVGRREATATSSYSSSYSSSSARSGRSNVKKTVAKDSDPSVPKNLLELGS